MFCSNCGTKLNENDLFCPNCGTKRQSHNHKYLLFINVKKIITKIIKFIKTFINYIINSINNNRKIFFALLITTLILIVSIGTFKSISNHKYHQNIHYTFKINEKNFKIGEKVSYYEKKGYSYKDKYYKNTDFIVPDGFIPHLFYFNNEAVMYAAIHCKENKNCEYSNGNIIKINFYDNIGDVLLADFIKLGTAYDDIVSKLGEPDGTFYMNDNEYVWSFYDKGEINNPYYVLEFDSSKTVIGIKIGVW